MATISRIVMPGNRVAFTDRFGNRLEGVVVRVVRFGWCPGANTYTVYVEESPAYGGKPCVYSISLGGFVIVEQPDEATRTQAVEAAHTHYSAYLADNYPKWRERLAQQPDYQLFGPSYP